MAKIKFRRDTAAAWTQENPTLAQGEPGFEHDTGLFKIGDGATAWTSLDYSGGGDQLVNGDSSFSVSSDGTLTLTHPPESDPIVHPLSTTLTIQKAAGNYHTISGAYGLSLQATPVPSGYGLNTNTNFVDIFHDGISVNVNDNTWGFGTDGALTLPSGSYITETAAPLGAAKSLDLHPGNPIYPTQYLRIYPTNGGDADHLHLTSGDLTATELFLGDDEQYVKLTNNGNVEIRTGALDYYNDTKGVWTFDSDGVLTLPTHNATPGSRIKSAVDITIETGPYYLVDLVTVGSGNGGGICVLDFLIYSAPDWATAVAVGDHVVSGTWTGIITAVEELSPGEDGRWRVTFAGEDFTGNDDKWSFYRPGAAGGTWKFGADGDLTLPVGGDILDSTGASVLSGGSTGNFTFNADTIANDNDASIVVGGSSLGNIEVNAVDELVPPGGVWRLFIGDEAYPTLGTTVQIGDTVTTSWGTPITATITDIQQDNGNWQIHVDQDITAGHDDYDTVTFSTVVTTKTWTFGQDGSLQIPGGITGNNDINITVDSGDSSTYTWNFGQTGDLTAPGDITTGLDGLGGRFIQDCADGDTSMRWINVNQGSSNTQLIRAYTGDPKLNTEVERAQIKLNWDETEDKSGLTIRTFNQTDPNNEVDHDWLFKGDGVLQLPVGGDIVDSNGDSVLGGGTSIQSTTWVQDFETSLGAPADVPLMATSVEYLANGDIVALFTHDVNSNSSTYSGVARFDSYGTKVWSMKFEGNDGDIYANGWGLAVDNNNGFIYVAGSKEAATGYEVATLTKLSEIDGDVVWSKSYDVGYNNSNMVVDVASDGNPVVVGYADNGTDNQVVTTKINADTGSVTWSRALNGQGDEEAYGMAVGPSGEVVSVGYMDTIIDYVGPVRTVLTLTATPASDPDWTTDILGVTNGGLTYDITFAGGVATFSNIVDVTGNRSVSDFAGNITGDQIGSGTTNMTVTVATTTMEDLANRILVVKYLSDGTIDWEAAVQVEAGYDCKGADADIDGSGSIYVCGNFDYSDGTGGTYQAIIMFKFDSAGVKQWSRKVQGDCEDFAASIVVGPDNYLYLSAVTGTTNTSDYTMVIAKYNTNGTVVWQRLLDNTTTWTFCGALFFNNSGGSNLAVRDGYVAVSGSFGDPGTTPNAVVAQFDTLGTTFSMGDYDFIAASFSGVLDSDASAITVDGASKLDSDYIEEFTTSNFSPTVDLTSDLIGTRYSSTNGTVGTVKLISPGSRKIEEVYGYNSVSVTSRNFGSVVTSTAAVANTGATQSIPISVSALELADLVALVNGTVGYYFEVSLDQSSWRKATYGGYDNTLGSEYFVFYLTNSSLPVSQGQTAYYRIVTGADPVVWWNAADLPNGDNNFRGATIDYHAWTGESTIIGTIHIVNDSGEDHISHSEVQSGSSDGENDDLWVVLNEGTVSYQRIDGESKTLKIQWTAKVFYGSEFYD